MGNNLLDAGQPALVRSVAKGSPRNYYAPAYDFGVGPTPGAGVAAVLWSYFDDSGRWKDKNHDFVCLAGFVMDDAHGSTFLPKWEQMIERHGITGIHMNELVHRRGQYEKLGWDAQRVDVVISEAIKIIKDVFVVGIALAADAKYFRSMAPAKQKILGGDPHFLLFHRTMRKVINAFERLHDPGAIIFDHSEDRSGRVFGYFNRLRKERPEVRRWVSNICFADDEIMPPLQAADIFAYLTLDHLQQKQAGYESRRFNELMTPDPLWPMPYVTEISYGPDLEAMVAGYDA